MRRRTTRRKLFALTTGLALAVTTLFAAACGDDPTATPGAIATATTTPTATATATASASPSGTPIDAWTPVPADQLTTTATGLMYKDEVVGTGERPKTDDCIAVHYTGRLDDGTIFDSSVGGSPFTFFLGTGSVIPGWDEGLASMQVGGKRVLVIPSDLAYGPDGRGEIPPDATLIFDVELRAIRGNAACQ